MVTQHVAVVNFQALSKPFPTTKNGERGNFYFDIQEFKQLENSKYEAISLIDPRGPNPEI